MPRVIKNASRKAFCLKFNHLGVFDKQTGKSRGIAYTRSPCFSASSGSLCKGGAQPPDLTSAWYSVPKASMASRMGPMDSPSSLRAYSTRGGTSG